MRRVIEPTQTRGEATQRRIFRATERLLAQKPFHRLTVAEIARAAGVSVGNFYNRFRDKQALLLALYRAYEEERTELIRERLEGDAWEDLDLNACIEAIVELVVGFFYDRKHLIRSYVLYYRTHTEEASSLTRRRLRGLAEAFVERLLEAAERDGVRLTPRRAALAYQFVLALSRELVLFSDDPSKQPLELEPPELRREIAAALRAYTSAEAE